MPWSDWVQTPLDWKPKAPQKYASTGTRAADSRAKPGNAAEQIENARTGARKGSEAATQVISPFLTNDTWSAQQSWNMVEADITKVSATASLSQRIAWHVLSGDERRDTFPPELQGMEEGVDFTVRPDRDGSEIDAYIEYEDGLFLIQPADIQGWEGAVTLTVGTAELNGPDDIDVTARVYLPDEDMPWPVPKDTAEGEYTPVPIVPVFGSGTTLARVVGGMGATATGSFTFPAGTTGFCWVVEPDFTYYGYASGTYTGIGDVDYDVKWGLLFPRWRYWIPDTTKPIPLRQRQRDDGLGSSTRRARGGTSRQRSIRQRGYY